MDITAIQVAKRFLGIKEIEGQKDNPFVVWCLSTCGLDTSDETPWCSAFINAICFMLGLQRSNSAWARSWLDVGTPVPLEQAKSGFDICIFQMGTGTQGHVGFYVGLHEEDIMILGGNQSNSVSLKMYPKEILLGVRRLLEE
jgi:uncharacterized protein (TIGR02594 family)